MDQIYRLKLDVRSKTVDGSGQLPDCLPCLGWLLAAKNEVAHWSNEIN